MTKDPTDLGYWHVHDPDNASRPWRAETALIATPPSLLHTIAHPHQRRPGARTLGGWRARVYHPIDIVNALLGAGHPEVVSNETLAAIGVMAGDPSAMTGRGLTPAP